MEQLSLAPTYEWYIKRHFSRIGLAVLTFFFCYQFFGSLLIALVSAFAPNLLAAQPWIEQTLSACAQYLIGIPLAFLVLRRLPKARILRRKISVPQLLALFCVCQFWAATANVATMILTSLINLLLPAPAANPLADLLSNLSSLPAFVFIVVLAPIFEELFFRKFLIDRTAQYGETPAILISGLLFGLFHGNLQQAPYAVLTGFVLGYAYVKSGELRYSIFLHMIINFCSWLNLQFLLLSDSSPELGSFLTMLFGLFTLGAFITGLVLFCIHFKKLRRGLQKASVPNFGKLVFRNPGMILYFVLVGLIIVLVLLAPALTLWAEQATTSTALPM